MYLKKYIHFSWGQFKLVLSAMRRSHNVLKKKQYPHSGTVGHNEEGKLEHGSTFPVLQKASVNSNETIK